MLLKYYDTLLQILESGKNMDVIYLDFAKVFDKIDVAVVIEKTKKTRYMRNTMIR